MSDDFDAELEHIKQLKAARMRLGLVDPTAAGGDPEVTVYSTPTCPYCIQAKQYLSSKGVKFTDVNVAADRSQASKMMQATGQMGVPQLNIGGKWIVGFNRPLIDQTLATLKTRA